MKKPFKLKLNLVLCLSLNACGGFLNPFDEAFLDWNNSRIDKEYNKQISSGYEYIYQGAASQAKKIANECKKLYLNDIKKRDICLQKKGFTKLNKFSQ
ncbi:hypothetical protein [Actinobacillus porcinus]|uniref:hypothetical protein n=1 Tax=Actinobacillus porcinus TaxID=51048 RepID=UPI002A911821|nr:hypothetical protein [Actinobacillus porcinus]MDY6215716.1 hypothetical protein [Actinobacillus porcinus]